MYRAYLDTVYAAYLHMSNAPTTQKYKDRFMESLRPFHGGFYFWENMKIVSERRSVKFLESSEKFWEN